MTSDSSTTNPGVSPAERPLGEFEARADAIVVQVVERAMAELRRGAPVVLLAREGSGLLLAAEEASGARIGSLAALVGDAPLLLISAERARVLGLSAPRGTVALEVPRQDALPENGAIARIVDPTARPRIGDGLELSAVKLPDGLATAATGLAKLARLLPAVVFVPLNGAEPETWAAERDMLTVPASAIHDYGYAAARNLQQVAEARIPLAGAEHCRVVAFRPSDGGSEHLAIVIGEPDPDRPLLTRIHSECFTGDLLDSLRCDCGAQLRGAIAAIAEEGAGVVLYLAQEGRGIGLINKLRAYELQDRGVDTLDANLHLGYGADERIYLPAAEMLRRLGFGRVRLLTNNPEKVAALTRCGIAVEARVPHSFPSNAHNETYLDTKRRRFGHEI
jgi:GTP cyclohydrolase II